VPRGDPCEKKGPFSLQKSSTGDKDQIKAGRDGQPSPMENGSKASPKKGNVDLVEEPPQGIEEKPERKIQPLKEKAPQRESPARVQQERKN